MNKRHKIVLGALAVVLLLASAIGMWIYWAPTTRIDREERELLNDMKRVPDWLFDCTCTNKQAFIDNVFLRIVRLSSERPRREYLYDFVNRVYSAELSKYCSLRFETIDQRDETFGAYGTMLLILEHTAQRAYEALGSLKVPKRERYGMYWRYLEKYGEEEHRMRRLRQGYEGDYAYAVRIYERQFLDEVERGCFDPEELALISSDFEKVLGRPLRTIKQIEKEWNEWYQKNISESQKSRKVKDASDNIMKRLEEDVDHAPQILLEGRNGRRKYVQSL